MPQEKGEAMSVLNRIVGWLTDNGKPEWGPSLVEKAIHDEELVVLDLLCQSKQDEPCTQFPRHDHAPEDCSLGHRCPRFPCRLLRPRNDA